MAILMSINIAFALHTNDIASSVCQGYIATPITFELPFPPPKNGYKQNIVRLLDKTMCITTQMH